MRTRPLVAAVATLAVAVTTTPALAKPGKAEPKGPPPVEVQLLALNDFHGAVEPPSGSSGRIGSTPAGGAEYLATHLERTEELNRNTLTVSAGDLIGASPLLSALFHDEPTIEAMNAIGLDLNAVGNHEFDEGVDELLRMADGGCHPTDGCQDGTPFEGADFGFLAANVVWKDSGEPIFPAYEIRRFQSERIAFIGMTLEGTPDIVSQEGIRDVEFLDEAETVNRLVPELQAKGVEAIVVLLHEGGFPASGDANGCPVSGPIVDIVERTDDAVDLWITGHTHQAYACEVDGDPVTSASSNGRLYTDIDLLIDRRTDDVRSVSKNNVIVTRDVDADPEITELIEHYAPFVAELGGRVVGELTAGAVRDPNGPDAPNPDPDDNVAGKIIADAQLAATTDAGAVAAFMNPGGVRADFDAGPVTYGEIFTIQPFGNSLVTLTLTGAQLQTLLKQQWCGQSSPRILLPSASVTYTYDRSVAQSITGESVSCAPAPNPVTDLKIAGTAVDPLASYRITVNSFLADGGDRFFVLREGTDRTGGELDLDALEAYLAANDPLSPPTDDRVVVVE